MKQLIPLVIFIILFSCNPNKGEVKGPDPFETAIAQGEQGEFPSIGGQIVAAREKKGLSRKQLAEKIGVSDQNIVDIEDNRVIPTREIVVAIQKVLDCEIVLDSK